MGTTLSHEGCLILKAKDDEALLHMKQCNDLATIVFFFVESRFFTWRGQGEKAPHDAEIIGTAKLYCPYEGAERKAKGILFDEGPTGDELYTQIITSWGDEDLFERHSMTFTENPLRVQFVKIPREDWFEPLGRRRHQRC